ncbi:glucose dehydrogenase [FAD, quinone] [Hyalella azteca]|uniref:Glucose dehydrogenase [FAD, quinone] n=1 Tax=Hyalella azteca TaxID=294128 RepID=A0A8B7NLD3_HYAAZ|nr:glucose dehydrogenase [FAD, quinone] [Hyalella azteca]
MFKTRNKLTFLAFIPDSYQIPAFSLYAYSRKSIYNYYFLTTSQKNALYAYENNKLVINAGKVVGGSSAVNYLLYYRGNRRDYDRWAALGNTGWDYDTVLPYFKKAENYEGKLSAEDLPYHGLGGPLSVSNSIWFDLSKYVFAAAKEMGFEKIDPNAKKRIGYFLPDYTIKKGERHSAAEAYLKPTLSRPNLSLQTESQVIRILFNNKNRAIGVRYMQGGRVKQAFARKEVIISAGVINSPKLLMLSGIGPKEHLRSVGIKPRVDVPGVGKNFQDHMTLHGLNWLIKMGPNEVPAMSFNTFLSPQTYKDYKEKRTGRLTNPLALVGVIQRKLGKEGDPEMSDLIYHFFQAPYWTDRGILHARERLFKDEVYQDYYAPYEGRDGFDVQIMLQVPRSRGAVTLRSKSPFEPPNVDPNYFEHPDDVEDLLKSIEFALEVGRTRALREGVNATFIDRPLIGCKHLPWGSDEYWRCFIRAMSTTGHHFCCTCKMAPATDPMAVVSPRLRVHGVDGLRVVDLSIVPIVTSATTNAVAIMIGERAADFIKEDHGML